MKTKSKGPCSSLQGSQRRSLDHADAALVARPRRCCPGRPWRGGGRPRSEMIEPPWAQPGRHGDGRVAGEGADLEDPGGLGGEHQQLEEAALLAPDHHPPGGEVLPGRGVHRLEVARGRRRVRVGVLEDLGIDRVGHGTHGRRPVRRRRLTGPHSQTCAPSRSSPPMS